MMGKIAEVIVDISHSDIDRVFDYIIPDGLHVSLGDRVRVPFGKNRYSEGYIIRIKDESDVPAGRLKAVDKKLDEIPVITCELTELALWVAEKYHSTKADA
ncbi:MAG TPA: primosomal protein N', partial [Clostridia bacterium]|nr:primosomal protein N' [Clostridia bacterium]